MRPAISHIQNISLRFFSYGVALSTLVLIFAGSLVTSTGSGLSVPDWPLSYGTIFPPMVGGIRFEHSHRVIASFVGLLTLCLAIWLHRVEPRRWVRNLGYLALAAVVVQGALGGITVLLLLPEPVSIAHGVLAQTFFILTVIIAYSQSAERSERTAQEAGFFPNLTLRYLLYICALIFAQLVVGALMRHTHSGLAIPDFPRMGGMWWPSFDEKMIAHINADRFYMNLGPVSLIQVVVHFLHRCLGAFIFLFVAFLNIPAFLRDKMTRRSSIGIIGLDMMVALQVVLGIMTVLTQKSALITSLHVVLGASILGWGVLTLLRSAPITWKNFKKILFYV